MGWVEEANSEVWRDRDSLHIWILNISSAWCHLNITSPTTGKIFDIRIMWLNIFAIKLEIIFLSWCGKQEGFLNWFLNQIFALDHFFCWKSDLIPAPQMSDYLFQDEDQEPSQPANLNLAVLLFSAIIYHCGRHQPSSPAAQHQLVYLSGGPGKSWRAEKFLHHASVLGRFCQHFSLKNPSFFHHGQFWLQFKLDK